MKQKNIKKVVLLGFVFVGTTLGITYASWQAGGGVKWIANPDSTTRFTGPTTVDGVPAYTDTFTNLKWEANSSGSTEWATDSSYREPTWDGINYKDPADNSIIDRTNTKYPAFAHCVAKGPGWRLPTKKEWVSIMAYTQKNGSYYTALPSVSIYTYWSSTESANATNIAWLPDFSYGGIYENSKDYTTSILCIHD